MSHTKNNDTSRLIHSLFSLSLIVLGIAVLFSVANYFVKRETSATKETAARGMSQEIMNALSDFPHPDVSAETRNSIMSSIRKDGNADQASVRKRMMSGFQAEI